MANKKLIIGKKLGKIFLHINEKFPQSLSHNQPLRHRVNYSTLT